MSRDRSTGRGLDDGAALPLALALVLVISIGLLGLASLTATSLKTTSVIDNETDRAYSADAAIEAAVTKVRTNGTAPAAGECFDASNLFNDVPNVKVDCEISSVPAGGGVTFGGGQEEVCPIGDAGNDCREGNGKTEIALPLPGGVVLDDLLVAHVAYEKGSDVTVTAPAGWTLVEIANQLSDIGQAVYWRRAAAGEPPSYEWRFSQAAKVTGGIMRFSGIDYGTAVPTNPVLDRSKVVGAEGTTSPSPPCGGGDNRCMDAPSVTTPPAPTTARQDLLLAFYTVKKREITLSVPTGMEPAMRATNPQDVTTLAAYEFRTTSGDTPTGTGLRRSQPGVDKYAAQLIAFRGTPPPSDPTALVGRRVLFTATIDTVPQVRATVDFTAEGKATVVDWASLR